MPNQQTSSPTRYDRISGARRKASDRRFVVRLYELPWFPARDLQRDALYALIKNRTDPTVIAKQFDKTSMYPSWNLDAGPNDPKYPIRD